MARKKDGASYYSENDSFAAQWLRNLIKARLIPEGEVDDRTILDVRPADLAGFDQCHFFAGIAGWPLALSIAGWEGPVWTGSCPCQPLSSAGQRRGHADERHLWPAFYDLIAECRPPVVFGEQVAGKDGREWLAAVRADMEAAGYAVGAADLPACSVGAPHIRQRLYWVADSASARRDEARGGELAQGETSDGPRPIERGGLGLMADDAEPGRRPLPVGDAGADRRPTEEPGRLCDAGELVDADQPGSQPWQPAAEETRHRPSPIAAGSVGDTGSAGLARRSRQCGNDGAQQPAAERASGSGLGDADSEREGSVGRVPRGPGIERQGGPWADLEWLPCADGKARPTKPGVFPLVDGAAYRLGAGGALEGKARVGMLRAAGNAIVPQVAAEFVAAFMEAKPSAI